MSASAGDSLRDRLTAATLVLILVNVLSRVLGLVRDAVIAYKFGLSPEVSAYAAAIHVPDILNYLVAGGALSSAFVPLFREYWENQRQSAAWAFFAAVTSLVLLLVVALVIAFEVWTVPIVHLMYGRGSAFAPEELDLIVRITRIVLPAQVFFVVGGLMNGVIYSLRGDDKWLVAVPTAGGLIYNLGIIGGGLALSGSLGIVAFAWGGLVGALIGPFLMVLMAARGMGARYRFRLRHPGMRAFLALTLPLMLAVGYSFVDQLIFSILGARLDKWSVAALNNAYRLMQVPVGAFGIASATAVIGTLAGLAATSDLPAFRRQIREALARVGAMVLPVTALMIVLAPAVVRVLLQRGEFTGEDTARVAGILRWFAIGMYAWTANYVVSRGMYALKDTVTPAILSTLTTVVVVPLSLLLMDPMGAAGLALATSLGISAQSLAIFLALRRRLRGMHVPAIARSLRRLVLAAAGMGVMCWGLQWALYRIPARVGALAPASGKAPGAALELVVVSLVGVGIFILFSRALGEEEAAYLWQKLAGGIQRKLARALRRA